MNRIHLKTQFVILSICAFPENCIGNSILGFLQFKSMPWKINKHCTCTVTGDLGDGKGFRIRVIEYVCTYVKYNNKL